MTTFYDNSAQKRITAEMLVEARACRLRFYEFCRQFPDGVTFDGEGDAISKCVAFASAFDWGRAADQLLSASAWIAYSKAEASALEAREEARVTSWRAYEVDVAAAFAREFWRMQA